MTFGFKTKVQQDFTEDRAKLERALKSDLGQGVSTHLYSAVENAVKKLQKGKHRKRGLIVISDGGDVSFGSLKKFQRKLRGFEALMYPIETSSKRSGLARIFEPSESDRTANMRSIAEETGGRWFGVDAKAPPDQLGKQFEEAFAIVSAELRGQYSIGFYPPQLAKGAAGRIRVRAVNADYSVRTRKEADIK
jgi:VWFA-related protein